jgi:hypothetical protein
MYRWHLLQPGMLRRDEPAQMPDERDLKKEERSILCRECLAEITSLESCIEVEGTHRHTFFNPYGLLFEIGCFSAAPGVVVSGKPTEEFSWFPGFLWQHALCASCGAHLGWMYSSANATFFGLILNRLLEK